MRKTPFSAPWWCRRAFGILPPMIDTVWGKYKFEVLKQIFNLTTGFIFQNSRVFLSERKSKFLDFLRYYHLEKDEKSDFV